MKFREADGEVDSAELYFLKEMRRGKSTAPSPVRAGGPAELRVLRALFPRQHVWRRRDHQPTCRCICPRRKDGALQLTRIVEKRFFIDSAKSRILQPCDLCPLSARKKEERKEGLSVHSVDDTGIELIEQMVHRGNDNLVDVLLWLEEGQHDLGK